MTMIAQAELIMGKKLLKCLVSYSDELTLTLNVLIIGLYVRKIVNIFLHISFNIYSYTQRQ